MIDDNISYWKNTQETLLSRPSVSKGTQSTSKNNQKYKPRLLIDREIDA